MIKKFNFKHNFEFFTYEEVCSFYEEYKKTLYKENENVDFIAFMINFKVSYIKTPSRFKMRWCFLFYVVFS